jgi:cytochrome b
MSQHDDVYAAGITTARAPAGVRAWDLPTRLFKWSLAAAVIAAWLSTYLDDPAMNVHKWAGYVILTLVIYRIFWGVVGGSSARFSTFVRSPARAIEYLRSLRAGRAKPYLGHNPAGGLMILALLLACAAQALVGLFASDGVLASGPFADAVGDQASGSVARLHSLVAYGILGLVLMHIAVNLFYQFVKRENLIGAMITGRKRAAAYQDARQAEPGSPLVAALCLFVAGMIVYLLVAASGSSWFTAT